MLQVELIVEIIEALGRVFEELDQFVAWNSRLAGRLIFAEEIVQTFVRQFHDDGNFAARLIDALERQHGSMPHFLDALQSFQFLLGACGVDVFGIDIAVDELDGFEQIARGEAFPYLAESRPRRAARSVDNRQSVRRRVHEANSWRERSGQVITEQSNRRRESSHCDKAADGSVWVVWRKPSQF